MGTATASIDSAPAEPVPAFPGMPFSVDADGLLHLGPLCAGDSATNCTGPQPAPKCPPGQTPERGVFDRRGNPVDCFVSKPRELRDARRPMSAPRSTASSIDANGTASFCAARSPPAPGWWFQRYTAEAELADDDIQNLGDVWETNQTATEMFGGEWDCLVRSGGGRFLWLRLEFRGNGKVTPRLDSIEIEFPRISLRRYLPAVFGKEAVSADFTDRFLSLFDTTFRSIETNLDLRRGISIRFRRPRNAIPKTGADFLSLAGIVDRSHSRPPLARGQTAKVSQARRALYDCAARAEGLWRELLLFLDMDNDECCRADQPTRSLPAHDPPTARRRQPAACAWRPPPLILEHFKLRRWLFLGAGRLGDQAVLWGKRIVNRSQLDDTAQADRTQLLTAQDPLRDPFHVYAYKFSVFVPASFRASDTDRKALENILRNGRPAGILAQLEYVEPRFRIGFQSMIGFDSVVGRYPAGVTLNDMQLGRATVLTAPPHKQGGPSLAIGEQARIGTTTRLE